MNVSQNLITNLDQDSGEARKCDLRRQCQRVGNSVGGKAAASTAKLTCMGSTNDKKRRLVASWVVRIGNQDAQRVRGEVSGEKLKDRRPDQEKRMRFRRAFRTVSKLPDVGLSFFYPRCTKVRVAARQMVQASNSRLVPPALQDSQRSCPCPLLTNLGRSSILPARSLGMMIR